MKKIIIATGLYLPDLGGPATFVSALERELPKHGFEVFVLPFRSVRFLPKVIRHIFYTFKLVKSAKGKNIIFAQDPVSVGFPAYLVSRFLGKPLILKVVGDYAWEQGRQRFGVTENLDDFLKRKQYPFLLKILVWTERKVAKGAKRIIVPSEYLKKVVIAWGIRPEKIYVVYNAAPVLKIEKSKETLREELSLSGTVFFSAGRLVPWKGFEILIRAFKKLTEQYQNIFLYIAGSGPEKDHLVSLIESFDLSKQVVLLGKLEQKKLFEYLKVTDVFILPTGYEGLSHQLLEAMAYGLPIITTTAGGNPELIEDKKTGILVPYNDEEVLIFAMDTLMKDQGLRDRIGEGTEVRSRFFSQEKMIKETVNILNI